MDSDETTVENGSTKFTILGLLKKIVAVYLALISNVFTKIQEIFEGINGFIHDKVDEYAPSPIKSLQETLDSQSNKVINKTKSLLGGFSILGDIVDDVKSSITNPVDTARDLVDKTTSLVTDNPVAQAVNSAADKVMEEAKSAGKKAALKSVYASLTLLLIPLIAEAWYKANTKEWFSKFAKAILPLIEKLSEGYNNLVEKMEDKGYSFFEYLPTIPVGEMKAAYKLVKTKNDSIAAVADGLEDAGELASDIVGNIPIVGGIANSISNTADQIMDNTASLILDNPLSQAVGSVADQMMENTEEFATKAALKSVYTALTLLLCPVIAELCYKLREYALIKAVGKAILPLIEDLCEWYNKKIDELDEKGYSFFGYLPTMPITEMKTAYKLVKTANAGIEAVGDGLEAVGSGLGLNNDDDDDDE